MRRCRGARGAHCAGRSLPLHHQSTAGSARGRATLCPYFVLEIVSGTTYVCPVLLAEGHRPVMRLMEQDAAPARPVSSAGRPGAWGLRSTGTMTRARGARWTTLGQLINPGKHASAALGQSRVPQWSAERRTFLVTHREVARSLACRGGLTRHPGGLTQAPASLGVPLPLISRALRAAATHTAAP